MPPRPRPRPAPSAPAASSSATANKDQDDDDFFIRNKSRTAATWAKLDKINKDKKPHVSESEEDEESNTTPRQKTKKAKSMTPKWQKKIKAALPVDDDSDDSDGLVVLSDEDDTPRRSKRQKDNKRARSRSRSITPPPEIPQHELQKKVDEALRGAFPDRRTESAIELDDEEEEDNDDVVSDPELLNIVKNVRVDPQQRLSSAEPDVADYVTVFVRWKPHPLNEHGKEKTVGYRIGRNIAFRELYDQVSEDNSILSEDLVITHRGTQVFSSVTPSSLGIYEKTELVACDRHTYDYVKAQNRSAIPISQPAEDDDEIEILSEPEETIDFQEADNQSDAGASETEGETFKLTLRSAQTTQDIMLTVRPTTKCGAIVQAFLKKAGLAHKFSSSPKKRKKGGPDPRLCIDGDRVDNETEIGDMDLEDGDLVEVVGL